MADPQPRDVVLIFDRHMRPGKEKRHICICPQKQRFLRINSRPYFKPHHYLPFADNDNILDHNSYVELRALFRNMAYEIKQASYIGTMYHEECKKLVASVWNAETLDEETKEFIEARIG